MYMATSSFDVKHAGADSRFSAVQINAMERVAVVMHLKDRETGSAVKVWRFQRQKSGNVHMN